MGGGTAMSVSGSRVSRVEVIDATGRAFVRHYAEGGAFVQLQDDGATLKVFAGEPNEREEGN